MKPLDRWTLQLPAMMPIAATMTHSAFSSRHRSRWNGYSEELEWILEQADGELAAAAEAALVNVLVRLGRLMAHVEFLSRAPMKARWPR